MKAPDESVPPVVEESVEEEEDRVRHWIEALFGDTPDGVAISCSGRVLYANGRMHDLVGAREGELVGRPSLELYPDTDYPTVLRQIQSMVFSGRPHAPAPLALRRRDGSTTQAEVARLILPIGDESWLVEIARALDGVREGTASREDA